MAAEEDEDGKRNIPDFPVAPLQKSNTEIDIDEAVLYKRLSQSEVVLRLLSLLCLSLMLGLFLIQMDMAWRSRQMLLELTLDEQHFFPIYPEFYHSTEEDEDTWTFDPVTMLLKVNTSIYVR